MKSCKSFQWEMGYKSKFYKETWFYFMPPQYPIKWKLKTQVCTDSLSTDPNYRHKPARTNSTLFLSKIYLLPWGFILRSAHSSVWSKKWSVKCINVATEAPTSFSSVCVFWPNAPPLIEEFQPLKKSSLPLT